MSYSHYSSSSRSGLPRSSLPNDAEFQAAKMQAMMGAPIGGTGGTTRSYSYSSSSGSSVPTIPRMVDPSMDAEIRRMEREMDNPLRSPTGSSSHSTRISSSGLSPTSIPFQQDTNNGTTVKKVVTTTTTKSNPHAIRELDSLERDFQRLGKTPDNYQDDFEKIKREISTGSAYREDLSESSPRSLHSQPSLGSGNARETTTTTRTYKSSGDKRTQPDSSEVFIPVRTYDNTFDDFHMNRWFDHEDHFGSSDLDKQRMDWQNQLRGVKSDMFKFSPQADFGNTSIESSKTVSKNPLGNPEFSIQFDMREFKADDISLSTRNGKLIINATHEDKIGKSTSRREFTRSVDLPADIQINMMKSVFSRDGILSITAPIKPPLYDSSPIPITSLHSSPRLEASSMQAFDAPYTDHGETTTSYNRQKSRQDYTASPSSASFYSSQPSPGYNCRQNTTAEAEHKPMDYSVPVTGYSPEEITVSIEGRKVKVYGKHVESRIGGRKTHNEFTKLFDLPSDVEARDVRCYIKEGHTLHIIAHISDDITGLVHFLAVKKNN
ncbi:uncharacterized protein [Watersipora subatra]|uniref:uncharacterized protein isoform X2 n=1 Tax=Watersipora subatra TaxID=2589382 RepID=UPI00355B565D